MNILKEGEKVKGVGTLQNGLIEIGDAYARNAEHETRSVRKHMSIESDKVTKQMPAYFDEEAKLAAQLSLMRPSAAFAPAVLDGLSPASKHDTGRAGFGFLAIARVRSGCLAGRGQSLATN